MSNLYNILVLDVIDHSNLPRCFITCQLEASSEHENIWKEINTAHGDLHPSNILHIPDDCDRIRVFDCQCRSTEENVVIFSSHPLEMSITPFEKAQPLLRKSIYLEQEYPSNNLHASVQSVLLAMILLILIKVIFNSILDCLYAYGIFYRHPLGHAPMRLPTVMSYCFEPEMLYCETSVAIFGRDEKNNNIRREKWHKVLSEICSQRHEWMSVSENCSFLPNEESTCFVHVKEEIGRMPSSRWASNSENAYDDKVRTSTAQVGYSGSHAKSTEVYVGGCTGTSLVVPHLIPSPDATAADPLSNISASDILTRHSSLLFVSRHPKHQQSRCIPWDILISDSTMMFPSEQQQTSEKRQRPSQLSAYLLELYVPVPLLAHIPALLKIHRFPFSSYSVMSASEVQPDGSHGKYRDSGGRIVPITAATVSSLPLWKKKGPMKWDIVKSSGGVELK